MRKELIEELYRETLGPSSGSQECIEENPYNRYVTGVIIPRSVESIELGPDSEDTTGNDDDLGGEDESSDQSMMAWTPSELDPRLKPKAFGISFPVNTGEPKFRACITWGRYSKGKSSQGVATWTRQPFHCIVDVKNLGSSVKTVLVYDKPDGRIRLNIRLVGTKNKSSVVVNLINDLTVKSKPRSRPGEPDRMTSTDLAKVSLFQPSIRILLDESTELSTMSEYTKGDKLQFLYRDKPTRARGFMCAAVWDEIDGMGRFLDDKVIWPDADCFKECAVFRRCHVRSEFVPAYAIPSPLLGFEELGLSPRLKPDELAEAWDGKELEGYLQPMVDAYEKWISGNEKVALNDPTASELIQAQKVAAKRMREGIRLLIQDENARLCFCFANKVIAQQHSWKSGEDDFVWYPFQIAFFLMNVEPLSNDGSINRDVMDLLWIPTGGGKTETYLAIMAYAIANRRRHVAKEFESDGGVSVITRYTLRLLTVQQFRRTLRMITAAEYLRTLKTDRGYSWRPKKCRLAGNWLYGTVRFSCGLWVGRNVTPNQLVADQNGAISLLAERKSSDDFKAGEPAQVLTCPVCNAILAVPKNGIPEKSATVHWVIRHDEPLSDLVSKIKSSIRSPISGLVDVTADRHRSGYATLTLSIKASSVITEYLLDESWETLNQKVRKMTLSCARASRPGYFLMKYSKKLGSGPTDFEIYCPNPKCTLNGKDVDYVEKVPLNPRECGSELEPECRMVERWVPAPFSERSRVPIPAYTVDEQIYGRCPTVVVATADKIPRIAFEPRAATMMGNVTFYNAYHGYHRVGLFPFNRDPENLNCSKAVKPFRPPELVVQDELHLMEGPLGSMFGAYEVAVEGLMKMMGGRPKYIASTATAKDVDLQVNRLFARKLQQFPAYGNLIDDSFFVKESDPYQAWNENVKGRIHIGLCTPGIGPNTPMTRVWSSLLSKSAEMKSDPNARYYWTIVGYFNTIKSLGATWALYRENIVDRYRQILKSKGMSPSSRVLDMEKVVMLSGIMSSTEVPQILSQLETAEKRGLDENNDAIMTTSMFGTGVDIPHLSTMLVDGQPKTTSQYIQATGRVGRKHGGIVLTFLRSTRPRDLSHYELFTGYHRRLYVDVESPSVSPFSEGALQRTAGPVLVSFLRNFPGSAVKWSEKDGRVVLNSKAGADFKLFTSDVLTARLKNVDGADIASIVGYFDSQFDRWIMDAHHSNDLTFVEYIYDNNPTPKKDVVLGDPPHSRSGRIVVYVDAPQSLRDVEETIDLEV